eukprot:CAMPEP_0171119442 /NCGR_PEP_ID=MMETSP0766_2-20121228/97290_1 /TAXON_ID=439317 /ORGANISM="Gambierdiscus australes, Strain CAWD 149" /LENGTH=139 /DNA_ID=CAMNT_0011582111 /DNA_START=237 /DNA_END=653 /DNA_ORIENTATION=-
MLIRTHDDVDGPLLHLPVGLGKLHCGPATVLEHLREDESEEARDIGEARHPPVLEDLNPDQRAAPCLLLADGLHVGCHFAADLATSQSGSMMPAVSVRARVPPALLASKRTQAKYCDVSVSVPMQFSRTLSSHGSAKAL